MNKPRLKEKYEKEIIPAMMEEFDLKNKMAVPKIKKICINVGVRKMMQKNPKSIEKVSESIKTSPSARKFFPSCYGHLLEFQEKEEVMSFELLPQQEPYILLKLI